jgi:hypothetical protein
MKDHIINSIQDLIIQVKADTATWGKEYKPWFRGQCVDKPLLPRLYRAQYQENALIQYFRMKAPTMGKTPKRDNIDEWLFLMQHHGLPTRLLDWTEGALIALFFAIDTSDLENANPVVWLLNPLELNRISVGQEYFSLTWVNFGIEYIRAAFTKTESKYANPCALYPPNIHPRISVQKSCFTIHGAIKEPIEKLFNNTDLTDKGFLKKYTIDKQAIPELIIDLSMLGISNSTLFPDFDGLSKELARIYKKA